VAVFPDRIVLKNSTDTEAEIRAAISAGGLDQIGQGELVLGLETGDTKIYTIDAEGNVIVVSSGSAMARAIVSETPPTVGLNNQPLVDGDVWFLPSAGVFYIYSEGQWLPASGGSPGAALLGDLTDVTLGAPAQNQVLTYYNGYWENRDFIAAWPMTEVGDLTTYDGSDPVRLPKGSETQVLTIQNGMPTWTNPGAGALELDDLNDVQLSGVDSLGNPIYLEDGQVIKYDAIEGKWLPGSTEGLGTVTSVDIESPTESIYVSGGPVTGSGTIYIELPEQTVTPGEYAAAVIDVSQTGIVTAVREGGLNDLSDVDIFSVIASDGDSLAWDASQSKWVPRDGGVGIIIAEDPPTTRPNGELLQEGDSWWESDTGAFYIYYDGDWVQSSGGAGGGGASALSELTDVNTTSPLPTNGQVLAWDNTAGVWAPSTPSIGVQYLGDLLDVSATPPADANVLAYNSDTGSWEPSAAGAGNVSSVDAVGEGGITVTGGPITDAGTFTITLDDKSVSPGTYRSANVTVDQQGRISSISDGFQDPLLVAGDMIYRGSSATTRLPIGNQGQVLSVSSGLPVWVDPTSTSGGTVTSVDIEAGYGIDATGGPVTGVGTFNVALQTVSGVQGSYTNPNVTIDNRGRVTAITNGTGVDDFDRVVGGTYGSGV